MKKLFKHEDEAAGIIAGQPRVMLFDDMGMGKTVTVLEGLRRASQGSKNPFKIIVLAPNTLLGQWAKEIDEWLKSTGFVSTVVTGNKSQRAVKYNYFRSIKENVVLLTNYSLLMKDDFYSKVVADALIIDEGYFLRNNKTKLYCALKSFVYRFDRVIMLSGNFESFTNGQFYNLTHLLFSEIIKGPKETIVEQLGDSFISRSFSDVNLDQTINTEPEIKFVEMHLNEDQESQLKALSIIENRESKHKESYNPREFINKKKLILLSPRITDNTLSLTEKESFLKDLLLNSKGKTVIYCKDRKFFRLLKTDLFSWGISFQFLSGEMTTEQRTRQVNLFNLDEKSQCLLMSGVGKFGLNLQAADTLICMTVPNNLFELQQLLGRLIRINQDKQVCCFIPYYTNSIENEYIKKFG